MASNAVPPLYVSITHPRGTECGALRLLEDAHGVPLAAGAGAMEVPGCFRLENRKVVADGRIVRAINRGELVVADASSQAVAALAVPDCAPRSFLEIGAGRGTKTLLIQSEAHRRFGSFIERYVTVDLHEFKANVLRKRAEDAGVPLAAACVGDATDLDAVVGGEQFDAVFIDAPCSGLGTLRRHPEIRWRVTPQSLEEHGALDDLLLASAASHVAPGGILSYATCTVDREENADPVARFLKSPIGKDFSLEPILGAAAFAPSLTPDGPDAHFAVKMRRLGA